MSLFFGNDGSADVGIEEWVKQDNARIVRIVHPPEPIRAPWLTPEVIVNELKKSADSPTAFCSPPRV
jgi:hypothetical protein